MKRNYQTPTLYVMKIQHQSYILQGSQVDCVAGNASLNYGGAGDGTEAYGGAARVKGNSVDWDDWE